MFAYQIQIPSGPDLALADFFLCCIIHRNKKRRTYGDPYDNLPRPPSSECERLHVAHMLPDMTKIDEGKKKGEMIEFAWKHRRGVSIAKHQIVDLAARESTACSSDGVATKESFGTRESRW